MGNRGYNTTPISGVITPYKLACKWVLGVKWGFKGRVQVELWAATYTWFSGFPPCREAREFHRQPPWGLHSAIGVHAEWTRRSLNTRCGGCWGYINCIWRTSHVLVYHDPLQIATFWEWLAIYFDYGVHVSRIGWRLFFCFCTMIKSWLNHHLGPSILSNSKLYSYTDIHF